MAPRRGLNKTGDKVHGNSAAHKTVSAHMRAQGKVSKKTTPKKPKTG